MKEREIPSMVFCFENSSNLNGIENGGLSVQCPVVD